MTTENTHEPRFAFCPSCGREQRGAPPGPQRRYLVAAQHGGKSDLAGTGDVGRDHHSGPGALMGEVDEPLPARDLRRLPGRGGSVPARAVRARLSRDADCRLHPAVGVQPGLPTLQPARAPLLPGARDGLRGPGKFPFRRAYSGAWLPSKSIH